MITKLKTLTFSFFFIFSIFSFSKDSYVFNENRIKKVFCQWEITQEDKEKNYFMRLYNKDKDVFIDISNYAKGDSKEEAKERFHNLSLSDGYKYIGKNNISKKILGQASNEYSFKNILGEIIKNTLIFDKVKVSIRNSSTEDEYIKTLKLVKEAIDPSMKIKERTPLVQEKIYQVDDMFNTKKIAKTIKKYNKRVFVLEEAEGDNEVGQRISFALDDAGIDPVERSVIIEANIHFSKEVQERRWKNFMKNLTFRNPVIDKTSEKYFGVPSIQMISTKPKNYGYDAVGVGNLIITEDYTIFILNYTLKGNNELQKREYSELLQIVKDNLKNYKK